MYACIEQMSKAKTQVQINPNLALHWFIVKEPVPEKDLIYAGVSTIKSQGLCKQTSKCKQKKMKKM